MLPCDYLDKCGINMTDPLS